jgi:hypothetical protein
MPLTVVGWIGWDIAFLVAAFLAFFLWFVLCCGKEDGKE